MSKMTKTSWSNVAFRFIYFAFMLYLLPLPALAEDIISREERKCDLNNPIGEQCKALAESILKSPALSGISEAAESTFRNTLKRKLKNTGPMPFNTFEIEMSYKAAKICCLCNPAVGFCEPAASCVDSNADGSCPIGFAGFLCTLKHDDGVDIFSCAYVPE